MISLQQMEDRYRMLIEQMEHTETAIAGQDLARVEACMDGIEPGLHACMATFVPCANTSYQALRLPGYFVHVRRNPHRHTIRNICLCVVHRRGVDNLGAHSPPLAPSTHSLAF